MILLLAGGLQGGLWRTDGVFVGDHRRAGSGARDAVVVARVGRVEAAVNPGVLPVVHVGHSGPDAVRGVFFLFFSGIAGCN